MDMGYQLLLSFSHAAGRLACRASLGAGDKTHVGATNKQRRTSCQHQAWQSPSTQTETPKQGAAEAHHEEAVAPSSAAQVVGVAAGAVMAAQRGAPLVTDAAPQLTPTPDGVWQACQVLVAVVSRDVHLAAICWLASSVAPRWSQMRHLAGGHT